jgi:beta-galactosidase
MRGFIVFIKSIYENIEIKLLLILSFLIWLFGCNSHNQGDSRTILLLDKGWKFINKEVKNGEDPSVDDSMWADIEVPHDWAISGDFNKDIDVHVLGTKKYLGRTGALSHVGIGWYRKSIDIPSKWEGKKIFIEFDGAMSRAKIYLNGEFIGEWPYGYASFGFDLTDKIIFGKSNLLAVRLENKPNTTRWYPGAGIYRNVRLVTTNQIHVKRWGTYITTPEIDKGKGIVKIETTLNGINDKKTVSLTTEIYNADNQLVSKLTSPVENKEIIQFLDVKEPRLWSINDPYLYRAISIVKVEGENTDTYETVFGFRHYKFTNDKGFFLNDKNMKLNGVCMHHDLGPLGAAINLTAIRRQLSLLKEMGCNAIRTAHNPPAPELLKLTDEMGFLVINEAFDEWKRPKCKNGYNTFWDEWAEKDMVAFIHRDRNHPSVIMWSIGNEIPEQGSEDGNIYCKFLVDICHREDPTRPVTAGFNNFEGAIKNGLAECVDIQGWNYKPQFYKTIHENFPNWKMYGSETVSAVSSRGEYFFPAEPIRFSNYTRYPYHCSSYDLEYASWAYTPDTEFAAQDSFRFIAGEFVWTGFDYLGEPTPFNEEWPARSSYFGIIDLAGFPKDRYYLYQSKWGGKEVLHLLPHWNWQGMEGKTIPVHCYTNFRKAELFLNGISQGVREKDSTNLYSKYRLVWNNVKYEPGVIKVIALDSQNKIVKKAITETSGESAKILLLPDKNVISHSKKELVFVTALIVDDKGIFCPKASNKITFKVTGSGILKATGNGDPTNTESFASSARNAFNGKCLAILQSTRPKSKMKLIAYSDDIKQSEVIININQ